MQHRYKDQCDICKKYDYCKGHNEKVLCSKCLKELVKTNIKIKNKQLSFQF